MNQARFFHPRNTNWQSEGKSDTHNRVGEASKHEEGKETGENTEKTEKYACKSSRPGNTICGVRIQNTIISRGSRLTGIDRLGQKGNF